MKILKKILGRLLLLPDLNLGRKFGPYGDYFAQIAH